MSERRSTMNNDKTTTAPCCSSLRALPTGRRASRTDHTADDDKPRLRRRHTLHQYALTAMLLLLLLVLLPAVPMTRGQTDSDPDPQCATQLRIPFRINDLNSIKSVPVCTQREDCYLTYQFDAIEDKLFNSILANDFGQLALNYTRDSRAPQLVEFTTFNLNNGTFRLIFDEVINASTVNPSSITLGDWYGPPQLTAQFNLTGGEPVFTSFSTISTAVEIQMTTADLNRLKIEARVCQNPRSCWVQYTDALLRDMAGNKVHPIGDLLAFNTTPQAQLYVVDVTSPKLLSFSLDLDTDIVRLTFDETVDSSSDNIRGLTFHSSPYHNGTSVVLDGEERKLTVIDDPVFSFVLLEVDAIQLKADFGLGTTVNNTYITHSSALISDKYTNRVVNRTIGVDAVQANAVERDATSGDLSEFNEFDFNTGTFTITFSEPVDVDTFNVTFITLQNAATPTTNFTLTGGTVAYQTLGGLITTDRRRLVVSMSDDDLEVLKLNTAMLNGETDTYLSTEYAAVSDAAGNPINALAAPKQALSFTVDSNGPQLLNYTLDLTTRQLTMTFDDPVDVSTLDTSQLTFQGSRTLAAAGGNTYTIKDRATTNSSDGYRIVLLLTQNDVNGLQELPGLATDTNNTFVSASSGFGSNSRRATFEAIPNNNGLRASAVYADTIRPTLVSFRTDMTAETLTMVFSEVVNASQLDATQITLYESADNTSRSYPLTGGQVTSGFYSVEVVLSMTTTDLNVLKQRTWLVTSRNDTYLSLTSSLLSDMWNNAVVPVEMPRVGTGFTEDSTPPTLDRFVLDLDEGLLYLTFSETVNSPSFQIGEL
eukprot:scpid43535/ scgid12513/ 